MIVERNGWWWPEADIDCRSVVFGELDKLDRVISLCRDLRVAVQAGGNVGVFPKRLAENFDWVYTFEPDPVNFRCLELNVPERNVFRFPCGLGFERGTVEMSREDRNAGAHYIEGTGFLPVIRLDDLQLPHCDLLYLDVEGYEWPAIQGAVHTIDRCRPVIVFEDKGLSEKYGTPKGWLEKHLEEAFGYKVRSRPGRDVVMV